ncbi:sugar ABC transporter ATP-binding protein, partial [Streptomyces sp. NPDC001139]
ISSDLPEVLGMSDRVLVRAQGRIAGELAAGEDTTAPAAAFTARAAAERPGVSPQRMRKRRPTVAAPMPAGSN